MSTISDCRKARELISGAVDGELSVEEFTFFDDHVDGCEICRNEFEREKSTQFFFQSRIKLLEPPGDLIDSIRARLAEEDRVRKRANETVWPSFQRYFWPAAAVVAILVAMVVIRTPDKITTESSQSISPKAPMTTDALESSEFDFQNLIEGEFNPQLKTRDANIVTEFIKQNAGYSIPLPIVQNADWIGSSVKKMKAEKVINVAYKVGKYYIYIYAFPILLAHSNAISLSLDCIKALDENSWFWNRDSNGNLQVTWKSKNNVCVVTSNFDRNTLTAYLKSIKGTSENGWQ